MDAQYLIEVHTETIFKQTAEDLLSNPDDSTLFRLLKDKLNETKWSDLGENGIDSRADILLFACEVEKQTLYGQLLLLEDVQKFKTNYVAELDQETKCAAINGNTALLLWQNNTHFSSSKLKNIAGKLLNGKHRKLDDQHAEGLFHFHTFSTKNASESILSCHVKAETLYFEGGIQLNEASLNSQKLRALKPEGFHITTRLVPAHISEISELELPIPWEGVVSLSMNYRGTAINTDQSPQVLPDADLLLHFNKNFDVRPFLDSMEKKAFISELKNGQFRCGGKAFYFRQIEANQVYIGRRSMGELESLDKDQAFRISGPISDLTTMKTSGLIGRFIEILPAYIATQQFADNCTSLTMNGQFDKGQIQVSGSLQFKEDHQFTSELLRFLLLGKFM